MTTRQQRAEQRARTIPQILKRISEGETLRAICRDLKIGVRTVYDWQDQDGEFAAHFVRAREAGFDAIADECLEIADDKDEDPASRRVRTDTRLKLLAKWDPRRYGDAMQLKHADAEGGNLDVGTAGVALRAAALIKQALDRDAGTGES